MYIYVVAYGLILTLQVKYYNAEQFELENFKTAIEKFQVNILLFFLLLFILLVDLI